MGDSFSGHWLLIPTLPLASTFPNHAKSQGQINILEMLEGKENSGNRSDPELKKQ